jgi:hypothetical protein
VKPLVIAEEAEHELAGSVAFYEKRLSGLGLDFERAAEEVLRKIANATRALARGQIRHEALSHAALSIRHSLSRYAGQNLDRRLCAHQPKTKLLENEDSVGALACRPGSKATNGRRPHGVGYRKSGGAFLL